jgi:sugar lactone lactonase YvrE
MPAVLLAMGLLAAQAVADSPRAAPDSVSTGSVAVADSLVVAAARFRFVPDDDLGGGKGARERLTAPSGVTTDDFGRVYVTDAGAHRLARWDEKGAWLDEAGTLGSEVNQFRRPRGVARLGSLGVAVLDAENRRVVVYDLYLHVVGVLAEFGSPEREASIGSVTPVALASDRGGAVYVADSDGERVLAFDFSGQLLRAIGGYGEKEGRFRHLGALATTRNGTLVAADRPSDRGPVRLQWLDGGDRVIGVAYGETPAPGVKRRYGAISIAVDDSGRVAVADEAVGTLELVGPVAGSVAKLGGLIRPAGLAFAPDGTLLVAESGAGRVRRFRLVPAVAEK